MSTQPIIRTLSQGMINKIAAGEVIERPASVVKELVENSLDAGATRIDVAVDEGGASLIRIVDNGCGIAGEQLILALSPHSTSKLADDADLFRVSTFGFRGEALASVAEVSQLVLRSRPAAAREGAAITSNGGAISEVAPCGHTAGTTIEVRHLFFNTPVRRKYLRAAATEFGHIAETFIRLALPNLHCHFTLQNNGRMVYDISTGSSLEERMVSLLGRELAGNLVAIESVRGTASVTGLVGRPSVSRSSNRSQYFFLNNRFIRDRSLQHALSEAYRGLLGVGRFPVACLHIALPSDQYDVNVHPAKLEVRFLDGQRLYAHLLAAVRDQFLKTNLTTDFTAQPQRELGAGDNTSADVHVKIPVNIPVSEPNNPWSAIDTSSVRSRVEEWTASPAESQSPSQRAAVAAFPVPQTESPRPITHNQSLTTRHQPLAPSPPPLASIPAPQRRAMQYHQRYLIVEADDGIDIIDQHALHERILFERLKTQFGNGPLESQRLLTPLPVDLSPVESACVLQNTEFLASLGLRVEAFGGDTILITAYPRLLERASPPEILLSLVEPLLQRGHRASQPELLDEVLHAMACHAAVKAGESMTTAAIDHLIARAAEHPHTSHCPHGRPTTLHFTCTELDKMFHR